MATKKKKTEQKKDDRPIKIERYTSNQKCPLTEREVAERADRAAYLLAERDEKAEEQKAQAKHAKSVIETMEAELRKLSDEVRKKATYRDVECERRYNFGAGVVQEARLDTGEVMHERPMTDTERQRELFDGDGSGDLDEEFSGGDDAEAAE